jgi:hypothetical protein
MNSPVSRYPVEVRERVLQMLDKRILDRAASAYQEEEICFLVLKNWKNLM